MCQSRFLAWNMELKKSTVYMYSRYGRENWQDESEVVWKTLPGLALNKADNILGS